MGQTTHPPIDPLLRITNHSLHPRGAGLVFSTLFVGSVLRERVPLCSPGWPGTCCAIIPGGLKLMRLPSAGCGDDSAATIPGPHLEQTKNTNSFDFKWLCSRTSLREET